MLLGENQKANLKRNMSKHNYSGVGSCAASLYQVSVLINGSQHIRPSPVCLCLFSMWCLLGWSCSLGCDLLIDAAVLYYEALVPHPGKRQNQKPALGTPVETHHVSIMASIKIYQIGARVYAPVTPPSCSDHEQVCTQSRNDIYVDVIVEEELP